MFGGPTSWNVVGAELSALNEKWLTDNEIQMFTYTDIQIQVKEAFFAQSSMILIDISLGSLFYQRGGI